MSSFTSEQVAFFRQTFGQFSDSASGVLDRDIFAVAVATCWEGGNVGGGIPSPHRLNEEFNRISGGSGELQWQQFFQVLIHLNLNRSESPAPPEVPRHRSQSGNRVQFSGDVDVEAPPPSYEVVEQEDRVNTLGRQLLRSVGDFFGVTETSQRGGNGQMGWEQFNERNMEEPGLLTTLSRRASIGRTRQHQVAVPDFPAGRSFDMNELAGDSDDEEEEGLTVAAPPSYNDVFTEPGSGGTTAAEAQHYPEPTRPQASRHSQQQQTRPADSGSRQDLIYNQQEAWQYYQNYVKEEKKLRLRRQRTDAYDFFGTTADADRIVEPNTGVEVQRRPKKKKKSKLQRQSTLVRNEVESLPSFWPIFIILVSICQVLTLIVLLSLYGGVVPIKPTPERRVGEFESLSSPTTLGNITYYRAVNIWIGASQANLVRLGAKFAPCMRLDSDIRIRNGKDYRDQADNFGCCENQGLVGTSTTQNCFQDTRNVTRFTPVQTCANFSVAGIPNQHPCCTSILGQCSVISLEECTARGGFYHTDKSDCQEVNCMRSVCGFNSLLVGEDTDSNGDPDPLSPTANQFWRFFTAIFVHLGVLHIVILMPVQLYVGIKIERTIGWLRVGIIYIISGVGGNLLSAIFVPYGVNAGASGAVFGLLGVLFVELFQFWQIVDRAWLELIKLLAFVVFLLALGTLPYVDNMAHLGGLLFGVPSAIIFVPYITFGKWDAARKRILLIICIPLLLLMIIAGFLTFYLLDNSFCPQCKYINCVPYVSNFCPEETANPEILAL